MKAVKAAGASGMFLPSSNSFLLFRVQTQHLHFWCIWEFKSKLIQEYDHDDHGGSMSETFFQYLQFCWMCACNLCHFMDWNVHGVSILMDRTGGSRFATWRDRQALWIHICKWPWIGEPAMSTNPFFASTPQLISFFRSEMYCFVFDLSFFQANRKRWAICKEKLQVGYNEHKSPHWSCMSGRVLRVKMWVLPGSKSRPWRISICSSQYLLGLNCGCFGIFLDCCHSSRYCWLLRPHHRIVQRLLLRHQKVLYIWWVLCPFTASFAAFSSSLLYTTPLPIVLPSHHASHVI